MVVGTSFQLPLPHWLQLRLRPGWQTIEYSYDRFGNRARMTVTGHSSHESYTTVYEYDSRNRLTKETKTLANAVEITTYSYDANGSETRREVKRGNTVVEARNSVYNGVGQLIAASGQGVSAQYRYRPDGLRHCKAVTKGGTTFTTIHQWDGQNMVMEVSVNENNANDPANYKAKGRYLRGAGLIAQEIGDSQFFYSFNAHGDVVQRIQANGAAAPRYDYDAFGNQKTTLDADPNPFRYCGEYWDSETSNVYLRNRYYDTKSGRFIGVDKARDGLNWYVYAANNPVLYSDPTGNKVYIISLQYTAQLAWRFVSSTAIVWDDQGNCGIVDGLSFGGGTIALSAGLSYTEIDTESIMDLNGWSFEHGGGFGPFGAERTHSLDFNNSYAGTTESLAFDVTDLIPLEFHGQLTYSQVTPISTKGRATIMFIMQAPGFGIFRTSGEFLDALQHGRSITDKSLFSNTPSHNAPVDLTPNEPNGGVNTPSTNQTPYITKDGVSPPSSNSANAGSSVSTVKNNGRQTGWYIVDANTGGQIGGPYPNENAALIQMPKSNSRMYTTKYYYAA